MISARAVYLIKRTDMEQPYWLTLYLGDMTFSADISDALQFARYEDAEEMLAMDFFLNVPAEVAECVFTAQ